jgi:hypothetical protein
MRDATNLQRMTVKGILFPAGMLWQRFALPGKGSENADGIFAEETDGRSPIVS